jgi:hypothetical protein
MERTEPGEVIRATGDRVVAAIYPLRPLAGGEGASVSERVSNCLFVFMGWLGAKVCYRAPWHSG